MEASSPYTIAIVGLIVGFIIGLGCYRLLSKGQREIAAQKQTLLEREHQIADLKKGMDGHLINVRQCLDNIRAEATQLEQTIDDNADQWALSKRSAPASDNTATAPTESTDTPDTPRDYADGKSGTLSEDFGLKDSQEKAAATPQPPRY